MQRERIALAGGTGQLLRSAEQLAAARGVVAAEVHRFAQLRQRIRQGFTGLAYQKAQKRAAPLLQQIGRSGQAGGTHVGRRRIPGRLRRGGLFHGVTDLLRAGIAGVTDDLARVGRRGDFDPRVAHYTAAQYRSAGMDAARLRAQLGGERSERRRIAEVLARRVGALGPEQGSRLTQPCWL